jgi:IS5 family transposase
VAGQKRRVTAAIKCDLRRRSAVEPCIGHLKSEHCMGRNHLAHVAGDAANAVLAAAGYNFRRLLAWLAILLRVWLAAVIAAANAPIDQSALAQSAFFTDDCFILRRSAARPRVASLPGAPAADCPRQKRKSPF